MKPVPAPPSARTAVAVIAAAALTLLAAACSSPSATGSGGAPSTAAAPSSRTGIAYATCMRSHGVPKYPDPGSGNELPNGLPKVSPQQLDVSSSQY